jgi:uncharacterized protein
MRQIRFWVAAALAGGWLGLAVGWAAEAAGKTTPPIRVLLVTGGHGFEQAPFFKIFKDNPEISFQAVEQPEARRSFTAEAGRQYDVIVTYDYGQTNSEAARADFLARLKEGKGLVVLHHAIAAYQDWPEYWNVIGARYYTEPTTVEGVAKPRCTYQHGLEVKVQIVDRNHPVTRGLRDFTIHDETYKGFDVAPDIQPLLTTDNPASNRVIGWTRMYQGTPVVYLQLGHDHFAYENPSYQQLVRQAIRWAAKRPAELPH